MPEISGGRPDQLGDLMAVLELGAVDLDYGARVSDQAFSGREDGLLGPARLPAQHTAGLVAAHLPGKAKIGHYRTKLFLEDGRESQRTSSPCQPGAVLFQEETGPILEGRGNRD